MLILEFVIIFALVLLNGFFAMAELAVVSARRARLEIRAREGSKGAARAIELAENPSRFLSAVQIGITLIGTLNGVFGGAALSEPVAASLAAVPGIGTYAQPLAVAIVVAGIGFLTLILGELVPKRIALAAPERIASFVAGPLALLSIVTKPIVALLGATTNLVLRLIGVKDKGQADITEAEVKAAIEEGTQAGVIDPVEKKMIEGVLALADRPVRAVMTPRRDVDWIDLDDEPEVIRNEIVNAAPSRLVVVRDGQIDEPIGVIQKKDLVDHLIAGKPFDVESLVREPMAVPEGISVLRLLELFKTTPLQLAFVVDEFGAFEGLVTLNDVLTAIAGELPDEDEPLSDDILPRGDGSYLVDGRTPVDDLTARVPVSPMPEGTYHTAAGLVIAALGRIPEEGDTVEIGDVTIEIVDMDGSRVDKLIVAPRRTEAATVDDVAGD